MTAKIAKPERIRHMVAAANKNASMSSTAGRGSLTEALGDMNIPHTIAASSGRPIPSRICTNKPEET